MNDRTLADKFPDFASFWQYVRTRNPAFVTTNPYKEQVTGQWFTGVHYHYRKHTVYWPEEEEFVTRFIAIIYAQYASICKKEKLYQQIYPKLSTMWKVKTTSRSTSRGENESTSESIDKPLFESPDYLISNYGMHGRSNLVKSTTTTKGKTKSDTGAVTAGGKLIYNFSETEDRRGISQVLGHFRELDFQVQDFINAKEIKVLFIFIRPIPKVAYVYDTVTGKTKVVTAEQAQEEARTEEEKKPLAPLDEEDDLTLPTVERLARFKKKQERLKKMQMGIVQGKIALRIEHIERISEAFTSELKVPPLGNPNDALPSRGTRNDKEWKEEVLDKASFWAKINRVVGFDDIKKAIARYVKLYEDSVKEGYKMKQIILLLCGRPGVGKSYISTIIAETLNRPLIIVSMNGKKNSSVFNGVEQEVPGANVGEILKAMSDSKHRAPVILLDEFEKSDKMVQQSLGNPTDKTLNHAFKDKFFELPIPIQDIIFIGTANYPEEIEPFIASRMTVVMLKPLSYNQRMSIARKQVEAMFDRYKVSFAKSSLNDDLLKKIIGLYKEWGVRKLKENIEDLALQIRELYLDGALPHDYNSYEWQFDKGEEVDGRNNCPYAKNRESKHKKVCDCFNGKEVEGYEAAFGTYRFEVES